ncbi:helix-turn-helix transcriptional regulator [Shimia sp. R11_0]|uniref:AraC family transcriptional regulator n=1 Tax=Shimia sp. R11_0 TaxID=2821096 RepID=UPI001ADCA7BF|nr:AraC family transcriptional regulator [Shimia sp. R11_0]MBO9479420.1 helix-turn-helix transcriptional regulator [Shimia sp. R11_0]
MQHARRATVNGVEVADKLEWFRRVDRPAAQVFDGLVTAVEFQDGFGLHTLNAKAIGEFETQTERVPCAVLHCFLEGSTQAWLSGQPMELGRTGILPVKMVLTSTEEPLSFVRRSVPGEYVRKVSVQLSKSWLDSNGLKLPNTGYLMNGVLQRLEWTAGLQDIGLLEKLAGSRGFGRPFERLKTEAAALELVASAFEHLADQGFEAALTQREMAQLLRIEELAREPGPMPDLAAFAQVGGVSLSTLRRLIRKARGCAPLAHLRRLRLEVAHDALCDGRITVAQAADMAGFSSPENFATAFRRAFALSPSEVRKS